MRRRAICGVILTLVLAGCGLDAADYGGSYEGTLKSTDKEGMLTYMREETRFVHISPAQDGQLAVQVRDECVVLADLDGDAITLVPTRCVADSASYGLDAQVSGSGTLDADAGALTLSFTLKGTITRANNMLDYDSTSSFTGVRR